MNEDSILVEMDVAFSDARSELYEATIKFGAFASGHEGIGIILEEFEELKKVVFTKPFDPDKARTEAKQVAAMAIRFMIDICPILKENP